MSNNGVGIGPVSSKGDSVSKRRRGPYRKWTAQITQDVSRLECEQQEIRTPSKKKTSLADPVLSCSIESPDDNFASGNIHSMDDVGEVTEERDVQPDNFQDYSPQKDEDLDDLINELHANAKENHFGELAEDTYDPITVLGNDIMQIAEDEVEECSSHSEKEVDPPLYPGSKRRLGTIVLLLTCFMIRFKLSQETIHYFLVLLQLILPDRNCLMGTYHGLKKYLAKYTFLPVVHYYCSNCYHHIPKSAKMCSNELCKIDVTVSGAVSYFVQISLLHQLQVLFNRKEFSQQVRNHRFHHLKTTTHNCIRDVYDSKLYQDLYQAGFLNNPNNLSFAMNTDGVAIFKSSKISMWPVYMIVNELPISERKARENMLMYGIWISPKKPIMWSFLNPLFLDLRKLESGVRLTDFSGEEFLCKAALLSCTCDLPAKSLVTNSIQFNGKHGCWHCLQPGETYRTESGGNCHVFPFNTEDPVGPKRTMEQILKDVKETVSKIKNQDKAYVTNGCKGPFWFLYLKYFNFADGMVIDYMHCVCEGVMKLLLKLWFGVENRNNKFSFYRAKSQVSESLSYIKPTINITRVPRSLNDLAYWKASEFRNCPIPILSQVLTRDYFTHFCLLVRSIYLLSQDNVSVDDLALAEMCMLEFVKNFQDLYSLRYMTMNVHQLVHLIDCVRFNGPLYVNNCFLFEDMNGFIVSFIHGTQGVDTQIVQSFNFLHLVPILSQKFCINDFEALEYLNNLKTSVSFSKSWQTVFPGIYRIDGFKEICLSASEFSAVKQVLNIFSNNIEIWLRTFFKASNSFVYGSPYKKLTRRNQSVIKYQYKDSYKFGSVKYFGKVGSKENPLFICIVVPFLLFVSESNDHIHKVQMEFQKYEVIDIQSILYSCILVEINNEKFICEFPNKVEKD